MRAMNCPGPLGAALSADGVRYCAWAPGAGRAEAEILSSSGKALRTVPLEQHEGFHLGRDPAGREGDLYGFRLDGGRLLPDPASRAQASSVHGPSRVVDPGKYRWSDAHWRRPAFRDLVIYELHVGTFTPEGTFRSAVAKLPALKALGVTALEIMPIADFPGERNWGYDGVLIYAPARCYGTPDDFRALVDGAHAQGLAVILDVVYNHFGPAGNYLSAYSPHYFNKRHQTPWGDGFNFDAGLSAPVREFFLRNPVYWMEEFHVDGFRFDATHEVQDDSVPHLLAEMTEAVHRRGGYAVAEDSRNDAAVITPVTQGGLGFDGVWADDFHHSARVGQTQERHSYLGDFHGTAEELVRILQRGWLYCGEPAPSRKRPRGTDCRHLPPERFVHCISNHDQTGNRALGERLNRLVTPEAYRMLSVLLCLTPYTPLLFMGQEWGAATPFLFFADHDGELGRKITAGRKKEFASFPEFSDAAGASRIPDPQDRRTFETSRLDWKETQGPGQRQLLRLYGECLHLRREFAAFRPAGRETWRAFLTDWNAGVLSFSGRRARHALVFDPAGRHAGVLPGRERWELLLSSEEARFGGAGQTAWNLDEGRLNFSRPEAVLLIAD